MRGTDRPGKGPVFLQRITPACAGNSSARWRICPGPGDHPRVCGEQRLNRHRLKRLRGSPPRVRGTVTHTYEADELSGITPACAGNSHVLFHICKDAQDHPRVCGEQLPRHDRQYPQPGSPPRVRGTVSNLPDIINAIGITPACAGNSFLQYFCGFIVGDHPRVCGEQQQW